MSLTERQIQVLREMVDFICQECGKHESEVGKLQPHRIIRGNKGGKYVPNNIKMICGDDHKIFHYGEFK